MGSKYKIGRDEEGLTERERQVFEALRNGTPFVDVAATIGVSKQRVGQLLGSLIEKGRVVKTDAGAYAVVVK